MSAPEDERPKSQSGSPTSDERIGLTAGVAAYVIWGAFPIFFHSLEPTSALEILAHRIVWTGVFLAIVLQITGRWGWVGELRADPAKLRRAWLAGLLISINWLTYVWAVGADRVLDASLGYFINPLLSVVLGVALLGEGIRLLQEFTEDPTRQRLVDWLNSMVYDPALVTETLIEERWALATDPETLASARRMYGKAAFAATMKMMRNADFPLPWAIMHKVKAPTLVTWGRDDRVSPLDMSLIPMRTIPNAELHVFPNCGHWVMIEQKQAFEATVLSFLQRG